MSVKFPINVLGVMSGTSLDGLDLALVQFKDEQYERELLHSISIPYNTGFRNRLKKSILLSNDELIALHDDWSLFVSALVRKHFLDQGFAIDLISSHGHTVFHEPQKGITLQIGSQFILRDELGIDVVGDFRSLDVAKGGEGAPLVPIGDKYLYRAYDAFLNLGGIANISIMGQKIYACDVCACNLVLNYLAGKKGLDYDEAGRIAAQGRVSYELLDELDESESDNHVHGKSLGVEFVLDYIIPIYEKSKLPIEDKMRTEVERIAISLSQEIGHCSKVYSTGGGVLNDFLVKTLMEKGIQIHIPEKKEIEFKEAIVFAFLGLRKLEEKVNVLSEVTGATSDSVAGQLFLS